MKPPVYIISLGCPRNLVDSEVLAGKLKAKQFRILPKFKAHCTAIVNTCAFIKEAKEESIDIILELVKLKKKGKIEKLIVTGCLAQRYPEEIAKEIGEIDGIFGTGAFGEIPGYIDRGLKVEKKIVVEKSPRFLYDHRSPRLLITPKHSVYVKIQEGCANHCSYCVIPEIRGRYRSRRIESVISEIKSLKERGAREINLIGQDTTFYGMDRYKSLKLAGLVTAASRIMKSGWIRLLYTHPAHYTAGFVEAIKNENPVCKYLDLPIQHINDKILKKMNRGITKRGIILLIERLRKRIPHVAIRTSIIVGFPGETDKDFAELERFVKDVKFERLGAFRYSREEGTRAFGFPCQVPEKIKEERMSCLMELQKRISTEKNKTYLRARLKVLIDEKDKSRPGLYLGRTEHDAPEVDGIVYVRSKGALNIGDFVNVKIEDTMEYDLAGSV